ncbi:hypothetical protein [Candidatus Magnetomonas plexicatena]|uniref:hypothetical protein n=1 Tax=Candidatus Magnetomonas plexicatena TaxID=2552947 RepID=UPI0011014DA9|nr:hypothetical protein E2O03_012075 [Nitrospirales bacterium LBB_01]
MLKNKNIIRAVIVLAMFFSVLVTNRYVDFENAIMNGFSDVSYYTNIAKAFPHLTKSFTTYHHAQRFFFPYIIGMISHITGISLYASFMIFAVTFLLATLCVMDRILYSVNGAVYALCMALIIFNPYIFRLYLFCPGMITDLMFLFGTSVIILGLVKDSTYILLTGSVVAILARQTAVMFMPGFFIWLAVSENFGTEKFKKKLFRFTLVSVAIVLLYKITGYVASIFGGDNMNLQHLCSLIPYIKASIHNLKRIDIIYFFVNLIVRDTFSLTLSVAVLIPIVIFCRRNVKLPKESWLMILFAMLIMFQPVMNGFPNDATRLVSYAVIPLITAAAIVSGSVPPLKLMTNTLILFLCLLCYIGSFHHHYSRVHLVFPSFSNSQFALLHYVVVAVVFTVLWREFFKGNSQPSISESTPSLH